MTTRVSSTPLFNRFNVARVNAGFGRILITLTDANVKLKGDRQPVVSHFEIKLTHLGVLRSVNFVVIPAEAVVWGRL